MATSYVRKKEIKQRFSDILRDPTITAETFLQAQRQAAPLFPEWNRRRSKRKAGDEVNQIVQRLESQRAKGKLQ